MVVGGRDRVDRLEASANRSSAKVNSRSCCDIDENGKRRFVHLSKHRAWYPCTWRSLFPRFGFSLNVCVCMWSRDLQNGNHEARGKRQEAGVGRRQNQIRRCVWKGVIAGIEINSIETACQMYWHEAVLPQSFGTSPYASSSHPGKFLEENCTCLRRLSKTFPSFDINRFDAFGLCNTHPTIQISDIEEITATESRRTLLSLKFGECRST